MKTIATGLLAVLLAATAACNGTPTGAPVFVSGNNGDTTTSADGTLTFSQTQSNDTRTPQSATGGTGTIAFTGSISTATPCWFVAAVQTQTGNDITVTVTATPSGESCSQVITFHNYLATITGLAAGTYTLTVIHNVGGTPVTAYDNTVVVR
jgi:ABC-type molybdate transport system substrate-binding protein